MLLPLVASACITSQIWRDDRTRTPVIDVGSPPLRAFEDPGSAGACFVELPAELAAGLPASDRAATVAPRWSSIVPICYGATVGEVLEAVIEQRSDVRPKVVIEDVPGQPAPRFALFAAFEADDPLRRLPGVAMRPSFVRKVYALRVPCEVVALPEPPPALGREVLRFELERVRLDEDGTPVLARIAVTPITLIVDLLASPFEIVWYFLD